MRLRLVRSELRCSTDVKADHLVKSGPTDVTQTAADIHSIHSDDRGEHAFMTVQNKRTGVGGTALITSAHIWQTQKRQPRPQTSWTVQSTSRQTPHGGTPSTSLSVVRIQGQQLDL